MDGAPTVSWWIGLSRAEFAERREQEQRRMSTSRFGRIETLAQGPATHQWRPNTKQKETFGTEWWG